MLQPILILGSKHKVIRQGADMMLDVPVPIYESSDLITGEYMGSLTTPIHLVISINLFLIPKSNCLIKLIVDDYS